MPNDHSCNALISSALFMLIVVQHSSQATEYRPSGLTSRTVAASHSSVFPPGSFALGEDCPEESILCIVSLEMTRS